MPGAHIVVKAELSSHRIGWNDGVVKVFKWFFGSPLSVIPYQVDLAEGRLIQSSELVKGGGLNGCSPGLHKDEGPVPIDSQSRSPFD